MTQKEIEKVLANTKVYVNGKSEEIQEKLFSLGYKWCDGGTDIKDTKEPFLFIYTDMSFTRSSDMVYFSKHKNREISAEQILALELTEPAYRPFKDAEECWQEMLKHEPFGWVMCDKTHRNLIEISDYGVIFINDDREISSPFPASLIGIKFADGTPFGIKED